MADSSLYKIAGQVRFCSKVFLSDGQELVHGADIISSYYNEKDIVEEIDKNGWSQELLTYQFVLESLMHSFELQWNEIKEDYDSLLLFDAITGNNDRHFYNWGIVRHIESKHQPYFSPIYDSARGLFWNTKEDKIETLCKDTGKRKAYLIKYNKDTSPRIGWEGTKSVNHLEFVKHLFVDKEFDKQKAKQLFSNDKLNEIFSVLDLEFKDLLSEKRRSLIKWFLEIRYAELDKIIS